MNLWRSKVRGRRMGASLVVLALLAASLSWIALSGSDASSTAPACPTQRSAYVGGYTVHVRIGKTTGGARIWIRNDGTLRNDAGGSAHWQLDGCKVTIVAKRQSFVERYTGLYIAPNFGNAAHPGAYSNNRAMRGTWYALRDRRP